MFLTDDTDDDVVVRRVPFGLAAPIGKPGARSTIAQHRRQ